MPRSSFFVLALLGSTLLADALPARAADISFESRTYVPARGTDGENTHVLLYEYLALDTEDALAPGLYLRAGGWGRTDLADETFNRKTNGELQYAFLGWRAPRLNAEARVGRLSMTAGVARNEVFDGLSLGSDLPAGFDVTITASPSAPSRSGSGSSRPGRRPIIAISSKPRRTRLSTRSTTSGSTGSAAGTPPIDPTSPATRSAPPVFQLDQPKTSSSPSTFSTR